MRYTFESFLCGIPVRDYIYQKEERGIRIERAGKRGYWSKQALLGGIDLDVTPLYKQLLQVVSGEKVFVLSTNVDNQFTKAGLPAEKIFRQI